MAGFPTPFGNGRKKYYGKYELVCARLREGVFDQDKLAALADDNFAGKVDGRRKDLGRSTPSWFVQLYFIDNFKLDNLSSRQGKCRMKGITGVSASAE